MKKPMSSRSWWVRSELTASSCEEDDSSDEERSRSSVSESSVVSASCELLLAASFCKNKMPSLSKE